MVIEKVQEVIRTRKVLIFEYRKQHRDGHIVWVRAHVKWIGEDKGCPLLHCVFHNISDLKETQLEMDHLVNSIPGGIDRSCLHRGICIHIGTEQQTAGCADRLCHLHCG